MSAPLSITRDPRGVETWTLCREDRHNALSPDLMDALAAAAEAAAVSDSRVVVLTGSGASFCAGGDLQWMRAQMTASRAERMAEARRLAGMLDTLNRMPKPLIARVQGQAFGGGVGLMAVSDVAVAASGARFGLTETRLGLIPATIAPYVIARMGEGKARRVFMSARLFDAEEAEALDLVSRVVAAEALDAAIEAEIAPYLAAAPEAVARAKALARKLGPVIDKAVIEDTILRLADTWETDAAAEGVAAFFEKRRPDWTAP